MVTDTKTLVPGDPEPLIISPGVPDHSPGLRILALDLGLTSGWALQVFGPGGKARGFAEHGIFKIPELRGESKGMRFVRFRQWLSTFTCVPDKPDLVVYEQVHLRGGAATDLLVGLQTRVQEIAAEAGINYTFVHTATLKVFATGNMRSGKPEMIEAAKKFYPNDIIADDNEADALLVLAWARRQYGGGTP